MANPKTSAAFERLLEHLKQTRGFDFMAYKRSTLTRRIEKRMGAVDISSYEAYQDHLEVHPEEFDHLFATILINVTSFFRDPETFEYLRHDAVPALLQSKSPDAHIRVWSAGCASGEECYSIAILFAEALGAEQYRERGKVFATRVDEGDLAIARQAAYTDRAVENVSDELRAKYFDHNGSRWMLKK